MQYRNLKVHCCYKAGNSGGISYLRVVFNNDS